MGALLFHTIKHAFIENLGRICPNFSVKGCFFHAIHKEVTVHGRQFRTEDRS
nr:MAG TPA: hypothetical protein [Caudoviricetes sp.]